MANDYETPDDEQPHNPTLSTEGYRYPDEEEVVETRETFRNTAPAVAAAPGKVLLFAALGIVFLIFIIYMLFFKSDSAPEAPPKAETSAQPVASADLLPPPAPSTLEIPPPVQVPVASPPPLPTPPAQTDVTLGNAAPTNEQLTARRKSEMVIEGGKGGSNTPSSQPPGSTLMDANNPNAAFAQSLANTKAEQVEATKTSNPNSSIFQGKIVNAVLETAIDTSLPGPCAPSSAGMFMPNPAAPSWSPKAAAWSGFTIPIWSSAKAASSSSGNVSSGRTASI